jgi:hypothetical protein
LFGSGADGPSAVGSAASEMPGVNDGLCEALARALALTVVNPLDEIFCRDPKAFVCPGCKQIAPLPFVTETGDLRLVDIATFDYLMMN